MDAITYPYHPCPNQSNLSVVDLWYQTIFIGELFVQFIGLSCATQDSKGRWTPVGPTWSRHDPGWANVGPTKFAVGDSIKGVTKGQTALGYLGGGVITTNWTDVFKICLLIKILIAFDWSDFIQNSVGNLAEYQ